MRKTCFLTAAGLLAALTVLPAQAQWYGDDGRYDDRYGYGHDGYGYNNGTFRCESRDRRTTRCPTRGYRVQLVRQFSDMACVRGRTWGQDGYGVWVTNGCRALFAFDNYGHGGWNNNGWNSNGHYGSDFVRCESRDNRSRTCAMSVGRNNGIRLVRQLSDTPCIEGRNWGVSRNGVWVSGGCRAEFVVSRGRVVVENGKFNAARGSGLFLSCASPDSAKPEGQAAPELQAMARFGAKPLF